MMNTKNYFLTIMMAMILTAMMAVSCSTNDNPIVIPETPEIPGSVGGAQGSDAPSDIVRGQVIDENGEAIIGATVKVIGTHIGTVTGIEGNFTLNVPDKGILEVSYIGYKTKNVRFYGEDTFIIMLEEDDSTTNDIVVPTNENDVPTNENDVM